MLYKILNKGAGLWGMVCFGLIGMIWAACQAPEKQAADPYKGFRMGVQSYSLRAFPVEQAIQDVNKLELKYIEIFPGHFPMEKTTEERAALKALLQENGVQLVAYGVVDFKGDENLARQYFAFAKDMGIEVLSVNPKAEELDFLDALVKEFDLKLAIHNHGPGARYDKLQDVVTVLEGRDPRFGACIDAGHFMRSDEDPVNCVRTLGDRIHLVHLKDIKIYPDKKVFTIQGEGDLDHVAFFKALQEVNFIGPLSLEYEENKDNPMPDMQVCMQNVREAIAKL